MGLCSALRRGSTLPELISARERRLYVHVPFLRREVRLLRLQQFRESTIACRASIASSLHSMTELANCAGPAATRLQCVSSVAGRRATWRRRSRSNGSGPTLGRAGRSAPRSPRSRWRPTRRAATNAKFEHREGRAGVEPRQPRRAQSFSDPDVLRFLDRRPSQRRRRTRAVVEPFAARPDLENLSLDSDLRRCPDQTEPSNGARDLHTALGTRAGPSVVLRSSPSNPALALTRAHATAAKLLPIDAEDIEAEPCSELHSPDLLGEAGFVGLRDQQLRRSGWPL